MSQGLPPWRWSYTFQKQFLHNKTRQISHTYVTLGIDLPFCIFSFTFRSSGWYWIKCITADTLTSKRYMSSPTCRGTSLQLLGRSVPMENVTENKTYVYMSTHTWCEYACVHMCVYVYMNVCVLSMTLTSRSCLACSWFSTTSFRNEVREDRSAL